MKKTLWCPEFEYIALVGISLIVSVSRLFEGPDKEYIGYVLPSHRIYKYFGFSNYLKKTP